MRLESYLVRLMCKKPWQKKIDSIRDHIAFCKVCGKRILDFGFEDDNPIYKKMKGSGMCYECAYWADFIEHKPECLEVIDGKCYQFLPPQKRDVGKILGMGGKMRYIMRRNGGLAKSNDVWFIADVPYKYRDKLPDTAWWTTSRVYRLLTMHPFVCKSKACLDRYRCFRFDYRREFTEDGPYNIPSGEWVVGDEHCSMFVDLLDIKHYDQYVDINDILFDEKQFQSNNNQKQKT